MLRLILLTLASLFGVLALFGTPELAGSSTVAIAAAPRPTKAQVIPASLTAPAPPAGATAEELVKAALAAGTVQAEARFDGPPLKPSPEYASRSAAAAAVPAPAGALYVSGASVNLRRGAAADAAVVSTLGRGAAVTPLGVTTGPWIEVEDADGNRGFVSAKYLSQSQPG